MENKKRNSVATVLLTIVCILWMYPIVLILINSLKKEVAITTSGVFSLPTSETWNGVANFVASSEPDIYFTKANDYEEDVYDNFKLTDYLKSCKELSGVEPYIPILRREGLNFNPGQFVENPANIEIDDTLQMKIMVENKDRELQKLKQSKNAAKGAVLAGYVTVIPPAFEKIINKLIKEVK